jgi:uncharacterized membrane protein YqjE
VMAKPTAPQSLDSDGGQSVGDLVAQAVRDVTQLVRFELDLAKLELRADVRRLGLAAALLAIAAVAGCLVVVLSCFALAYGLMTLGIWSWAAFLIVAGVCVVLAGAVILIVVVKVRGLAALRKTRKTVQEDFAMLKRGDEESPGHPAVEAG